jgi:glycosyltransferase involved in cell wall biosynthesis
MNFVQALGVGGTERQVVNLSLALDPSRFVVHFGCLRRWGELLEEIDSRGIPLFDYNVWSFRHPQAVSAQFRLARDIRRYGVQIVHSYTAPANMFAIPAAKLAGARVVASIRDMSVYLSSKQRYAQRLICKFADRIVVNANAIKDRLVAEGYDGSRICVIPNGIDLARFHQPRPTGYIHRELGLPVNAALIGVVGRVCRLKGIEDFLTATAIVASRFPTARFLIVGEALTAGGGTIVRDYAYERELMRQTAQLGLQDRVVFTGFRTDVERVLAELTVSVLPSLSEGLSNSLLESMAAGLPVVATRVGGTAEAVDDGESGLLVPPGDPDSLAAAICRLLDSPTLAAKLGHAARRSIADRFSMTRLVNTTSLFYESLLQQTRPEAHSQPSGSNAVARSAKA